MRIGLILAGGGAKGAFTAGVLNSLDHKYKKYDIIYGTSVGALNAVGLAYAGIDGLLDLWYSIKSKKDIMQFNFKSIFFKTTGIYNLNPLRKKLEKILKYKPKSEVYVCVVSAKDGKINYIHNTHPEFIDYVIASCSLPAILSTEFGYFDGGVRESVPSRLALSHNFDEIHLILNNPLEYFNDDKHRSWFENITNAMDIMGHDIILNDIGVLKDLKRSSKSTPRIFKYVPKYTIDLLDFKQDKIHKMIKHGIQQGYSPLQRILWNAKEQQRNAKDAENVE